MTLSAEIDKNFCKVNEEILVTVFVDLNNCDIEVERIQLSILQKVYARVPNNGYSKHFEFKRGKQEYYWNMVERVDDNIYRLFAKYKMNL